MLRSGRACRAAVLAVMALYLGGPPPAVAARPYPAPGPLPPLTTDTVAARYEATQRAVARALATAEALGDAPRAAALRALHGRQLLEFDARDDGRAVEVIGDLVTADRIAVLVPGSHTTLDTFSYRRGPGGAAAALAGEIRQTDPAVHVAVVAWLGYDTPQALPEVLTDTLAREGGDRLRAAVATLRRLNPGAPVALLCHSYGSVVCARAAPGLGVADVALYGSPGVVAADAAALGDTRVWVGRAAKDWIRFVPPARVGGLGFGTDPMSAGFGGRVFDAGTGSHGDYHLPGSTALRNLASIALGVDPADRPAARRVRRA